MTRAAERPASRGPLSRPHFRWYFAGNLTSNIGTWLQNVALAAFMLDLTGSSFWVGLTGLGLFVPVLLFAVPAGALADRVDRRRLLLRAQLAGAALSGLLTALVATGDVSRHAIVAISVGFGFVVATAIPAMQSLIPSLVPPEEMNQAIGYNALTFNIARVLGPLLAAATYTTLGPEWAFGLNAASYLPLVVALLRMGDPPFSRGPAEPGAVFEGLAFARRHHRIRTMLLAVVAIGISLDPIITLSPALAGSFGLDAGAAGWIVAGWGGGAVLLITAGSRLQRIVAERAIGWTGLLALSAGLVALGASRTMWQGVAAGVLTGGGYITATIAFTTTIQADVPDRLRGRVMALWTVAFLGPRAVAAAIDGAMADAIGPHWTTAMFAAPALVAAWFVRRTIPPRRVEPAAPPA